MCVQYSGAPALHQRPITPVRSQQLYGGNRSEDAHQILLTARTLGNRTILATSPSLAARFTQQSLQADALPEVYGRLIEEVDFSVIGKNGKLDPSFGSVHANRPPLQKPRKKAHGVHSAFFIHIEALDAPVILRSGKSY